MRVFQCRDAKGLKFVSSLALVSALLACGPSVDDKVDAGIDAATASDAATATDSASDADSAAGADAATQTDAASGGDGASDLDAAPAVDSAMGVDAVIVVNDAAIAQDAHSSADADQGDLGYHPGFFAQESHEHDLAYGWIGAGQPDQARLTDVVGMGARVITLRAQSEEGFDEEALVTGLGGTFIRYATNVTLLQDPVFREGMYDLYDAQIALGGHVYLHCGSSNRVGASWALYHAERKGLPVEEAIQVGIDAGLTSLESTVRAILGA